MAAHGKDGVPGVRHLADRIVGDGVERHRLNVLGDSARAPLPSDDGVIEHVRFGVCAGEGSS